MFEDKPFQTDAEWARENLSAHYRGKYENPVHDKFCERCGEDQGISDMAEVCRPPYNAEPVLIHAQCVEEGDEIA